jgi:hypothetical protein
MRASFKRCLFLSLLTFCTVCVFAQDWTYSVSGRVYCFGKKLEWAVVTLYKNGSVAQTIITKSSGKFDFVLEPDCDYILAIGKQGFITKKIEFDTHGPSPERGKEGFGAFIIEEINIFEMPDQLKLKHPECFSKPIALVRYNKSSGDFDYDMEYADKMKDCLRWFKQLQDSLESVYAKKQENNKDSLQVTYTYKASFPDTLKDVAYLIDTAANGALVQTKKNKVRLNGKGSSKGTYPNSEKNATIFFEDGFRGDTLKITSGADSVYFNSVVSTGGRTGLARSLDLKKGKFYYCRLNNRIFSFDTPLQYNYIRISYLNGEMIIIYTNNRPGYD